MKKIRCHLNNESYVCDHWAASQGGFLFSFIVFPFVHSCCPHSEFSLIGADPFLNSERGKYSKCWSRLNGRCQLEIKVTTNNTNPEKYRTPVPPRRRPRYLSAILFQVL